jgi:hypothetical protein
MATQTIQHATSSADRSRLLRFGIQIDAAVSGAAGLGMLIGAAQLEGLLGIPAQYLWPFGLLFILYAAGLAYGSNRPSINRRFAWTVIILNAIWVVDSLILLASGILPLTGAGWWTILVQALIVADFAIVQYVGLRRMR